MTLQAPVAQKMATVREVPAGFQSPREQSPSPRPVPGNTPFSFETGFEITTHHHLANARLNTYQIAKS